MPECPANTVWSWSPDCSWISNTTTTGHDASGEEPGRKICKIKRIRLMSDDALTNRSRWERETEGGRLGRNATPLHPPLSFPRSRQTDSRDARATTIAAAAAAGEVKRAVARFEARQALMSSREDCACSLRSRSAARCMMELTINQRKKCRG